MALSCSEGAFWATLSSVCPHLSPGLVSKTFRDQREILESDPSALVQLLGISSRAARLLLQPRTWEVGARLEEQVAAAGQSLLVWSDEAYPQRLRHIADPPAALVYRGQLPAPVAPAIAIVGSRSASAYGQQVARSLAAELAQRGAWVVSGGAKGVDAAAHRGALEVGGRTLAVRGTGLDVDYPQGHRTLFEALEERGASITELAPGTPPMPVHFPRRNRIISGWSLAVVVVEASERSGALVTARLAAEQGREVFAVPGAITNPLSLGPHRLLQTGAGLVTSVEDILRELQEAWSPENSPGELTRIEDDERRVLQQLAGGVDDVEGITARTKWSASQVWTVLLGLELKGWVSQVPGGRFVLSPSLVLGEKSGWNDAS